MKLSIRFWYLGLGLGLMLLAVTAIYLPNKEDHIDFNSDVRPILNAKCISCHGGVKRQGGFSLLFRDEALKVNDSGLAGIIPNHPEESELIHRVVHADPKERMPPEGPSLTKDEVQKLHSWIASGAEWEPHWAFVPIEETMDAPSPSSEHLIDVYIKEALEMKGLKPSKKASPEILLRRLSLDITGLPPTEEQRETYISDPSDKTYENLVDQLLDSPHFGEKWASMWLDLARYGDSQGYQKDRHREIWPYRDWVIKAFNKDMPFDSFTIYQLAGDLLPEVNKEALIATAFHRNTMTNDEGGTDDEEFRVVAVIDRVNTTFEVFQGITISCVQCHSHPYDPFLQKEYYELMAFFNNTADMDLTNEFPTLRELYPTEYKVPIMQELAGEEQRATHVFERGNWLVHGEKVDPDVPSSLNQWQSSYAKNRLGFAYWLLSSENPLTSRVMVNRFWEQLFGRGIVLTLEDFGTQGEKPTHPELLDKLAWDFVHKHHWHIKPLLKQIVMSDTYRQSSVSTPEKLEKDPYNSYLSRGPRVRLSAEQLRDQALAASGLLSTKMYGPPVMPPQPEGVWNTIRHLMRWTPSQGENRYRRAVYTYLRRSSPYPSFTTFDSPSREFCISRRIRTNTPLQALVTMNDTVYLEASEALAHRIKTSSPHATPEEWAISMYQQLLGYAPDKKKLHLLLDYYEQAITYYNKYPQEAAKLCYMSQAEDPTLAALHAVAQVIFNLDETITKE